jgi:sugar phosphate isomerase/epimerase
MILTFNTNIVCCYLYVITKEGYPPIAGNSLRHLEQMHDLGFSSVELEGIREKHLSEMYDLRFDIKQKATDLKLNIPYFCVVLPGLSSPDTKTREKNLDLFSKGCEIAEILGSRGVLDNAPLPPYLFPGDIPVVRHYGEAELANAYLPSDLNWAKYWDSLTETYREACDIAAKRGLSYQMHPCLGVLAASTDAFLQFHAGVKRDNLRFNFDTANQYYMKENLVLSITRIIDYVDYIHLSDNGGQQVEHLTPGQGSINWQNFFETLDHLQFKGVLGIDVGGAESGITDIDQAYIDTAVWLSKIWSS